MRNITRSMILAATPVLETIPVPEWAGNAHLRPLSVASLIYFMDQKDKRPITDLFALVVALTLCDEEGRLLFDFEKDLEALKDLPFDLVRRLGESALKANKLGPGDDGELAKNS